MFNLKTVLTNMGRVARIIPGATPAPPSPFERCAGCRQAGAADGNSQKVPDPAQFEPRRRQGIGADGLPTTSSVGTERLPAVRDEATIRYVDAAPVWCEHCLKWFHAVGCYSSHRAD